MANHPTAICDLLLDYLSGVCTSDEHHQYEQHFPSCPSCRKELQDLRPIWEAIPEQMELIEPPSDLKQQVMLAAAKASPLTLRRSWWTRMTAAVIFGVVLTATAWWWTENQQQAMAIPTLETAHMVEASQLQEVIPLTAVAESGQGYGLACIVDNGYTRQFVVYVFGSPITSGEEVYQVWLVDDEQRTNAGAFQVNEQGIGLLALPIAQDAPLNFDSIGITLEPNPHGTFPRGPKVYQSNL